MKKLLRHAIVNIVDNRIAYVKNESDFTRNRKLTMDKVIEILLSMKGGTLQKELYKFSKLNNMDIFSSSAFVQQRSKILPQAFKDIPASSKYFLNL